MALTFNTHILSLYGAHVGNDAAYQAPGTYGLTKAQIEGGVGLVTVTGAGSAYTTVPTFSLTETGSDGTGATFSVRMKMLTAAVNAAGTGYVPGEIATLTLGTPVTKARITVTHTKAVSATVVSGGTGGTPGAVTLTGTTGTGTKFQCTGTINGGGVLTGALVVSVAGDYTVNPTSIAVEPCTATASLTGTITVAVVMGALTIAVNTAGVYTAVATTATQFGTTGVGTGLTLNTITFGVDSVVTLTPGTLYTGPLSATFGSGAATATVASDSSNTAEERLLMLVDLVQSFVGSATTAEEVNVAKDLMFRMCARMNTGGTFNASTVATAVQKAGVVRFAKRLRHSF